jgi:hypothetical protein
MSRWVVTPKHPLTQLRSLYLASVNDGDDIADGSVEHLLGMTKLQHLSLGNTLLTPDGVRRLLAELATPSRRSWLASREDSGLMAGAVGLLVTLTAAADETPGRRSPLTCCPRGRRVRDRHQQRPVLSPILIKPPASQPRTFADPL